jgi:hypothetical protein
VEEAEKGDAPDCRTAGDPRPELVVNAVRKPIVKRYFMR